MDVGTDIVTDRITDLTTIGTTLETLIEITTEDTTDKPKLTNQAGAKYSEDHESIISYHWILDLTIGPGFFV